MNNTHPAEPIALRLAGLPHGARRAVIVASLIVLLLISWTVIVLPIHIVYEAQVAWRQQAIKTVAEARGSAQLLSRTTEQLRALPTEPLWTQFYAVDSAGTAGATLQGDVGGLLNSVGANVQSMAPLPTSAIGGLTRMGLRVTVSASIDQLYAFYSAFATHPRHLRVEKLSLAAPLVQTAEQNPVLTVTMDIVGFEWVRTPLAALTADAWPLDSAANALDVGERTQ